MVTKGIIKSIDLLGNTCTVHIPFFETAGNDPIIETATVSNTPGSYNGYKVGDVVYVAFEDGSMSNPVIIGKLYLGTEKEKADPRGVINVEESSAAKKATLPADSALTAEIDGSVPNTTVPYNSLSSIANSLNKLNTDVAQNDRDYGNRFKQVSSAITESGAELTSKLEQSASEIRAEVSEVTKDLSGEIEKNSTSIEANAKAIELEAKTRKEAIDGVTEEYKAAIKVASDSINAVVEKEISDREAAVDNLNEDIDGINKNKLDSKNTGKTYNEGDVIKKYGFGWDLNDESWAIKAYDQTEDEGLPEDGLDIFKVTRDTVEINTDVKINGYPRTTTIRYAYSDSTTAYPDLYKEDTQSLKDEDINLVATGENGWTANQLDWQDGKYIWQWTQTAKYEYSKTNNTWVDTITDKVICLAGASAVSYWLNCSTKTHTGSQQDVIKVTAMMKVGTGVEQEDAAATLEYRWAREGDFTDSKTYTKTFTTAEIKNKNLEIIAKRNGKEYARETIIYSPLNTPILILSKDNGSLAYDSYGLTTTDSVVVDAAVWLNNSKMSGVTYNWTANGCTISGDSSTAEITITAIDTDKDVATATCTATYTDNLGNNTSLEKTFTVIKNKPGKSQYKVDIYNDFVTVPVDEDGNLAPSVKLKTVSEHRISCYYGDDLLPIEIYSEAVPTVSDTKFRIKYTCDGVTVVQKATDPATFMVSKLIAGTGSVKYELYRGTEKVAVGKFELSKLTQGVSATSYWVDYTARVHKGTNQQDPITATAWSKFGNDPNTRNDALWIRYSWRHQDGTFKTYSTPKQGTITVETAEFTNADLIFELGAWDKDSDVFTKSDSEIITYSPINTPVLDLSNDSATLVYKPNGEKFGDAIVSSTATVYLDGQELTEVDGVSYEWSNGVKAAKIEISELTNETEEFTCIAKIKNQALFKNEVILTKVFTVSKQIQGEYSISYWLKLSTGVHLGTNQKTAVTVTAMQKVGTNAAEDLDESAILEYSFNGTSWTKVPGRVVGEGENAATYYDTFDSSAITGFSFTDKDLLIRASHGDIVYETETITYSPLNTPVLDLDNDTDTILYPAKAADDENGPLGLPVASKATLYLNGDELAASYSWVLTDCLADEADEESTTVAGQTVTVAALLAATARAECTATVTAEGAFLGKTYTKVFTVSKTRKGDNAIVYSLVMDQKSIALDPNVETAKTITLSGTCYIHDGNQIQPYSGGEVQYRVDTQSDNDQDPDDFNEITVGTDGKFEFEAEDITTQVEVQLVVDNIVVDKEIIKVVKDGVNAVSPYAIDIYNDTVTVLTETLALVDYQWGENTAHEVKIFQGTTPVEFSEVTIKSANEYTPTSTDAGLVLTYSLNNIEADDFNEGSHTSTKKVYSIAGLTSDEAKTGQIDYTLYSDGKVVATASFRFSKILTGVSITGVTNKYWATKTNTLSDADKSAVWWDKIEDTGYGAETPYLWNYEIISYSSGEPTTTEIALLGSRGKGIKAISEYYSLTTTSGAPNKPTKDALGGWLTGEDAPTQPLASSPYLWNSEKIEYTDGDVEFTDPALVGTYTRSITEVKNYYYATASDIATLPAKGDSAWKTTITDTGFNATNKYLWNYEEVVYDRAITDNSDDTSKTTDPEIISIWSKEIDHIVEQYLISKSMDSSKSEGATEYTFETEINRESDWSTTLKTPTSEYPYLWNKETTHYTDGTSESTNPVILSTFARSITGVTNYYIATATEELPENPSWKTSIEAAGFNAVSKYLWNYEEITYDLPLSNGKTTSETVPEIISTWSKSIKEIKEFYLISKSNSEEDFEAEASGTWSTVAVAPNSTYPYLWNKEATYFTDAPDTPVYTGPVIIGTYGETFGVNIEPSVSSIILKDENETKTYTPSSITINFKEVAGTTTINCGASTKRAYKYKLYKIENGTTTQIGSDTSLSSTVTTATINTSTSPSVGQYKIELLLQNGSNWTVVDTETIPVVREGNDGATGPQGVSIVSQTTYYALINPIYEAGDIAAPNSDSELAVYATDGNPLASSHTVGLWSLTPPEHTPNTTAQGWKYWTTIRTQYSNATAGYYSDPIINEDLSGVYELAQGKTTNYYSNLEPTKNPSADATKYVYKKNLKVDDCWFDTSYKEVSADELTTLDLASKYINYYVGNSSPKTRVTSANFDKLDIDPKTTPAYTCGVLKQCTAIDTSGNATWEDIGGELVANKLTANYINALDITAKKIEIKAGNDTLFKADGLTANPDVQIAGFTVKEHTLTTGTPKEGNLIKLNSDSQRQYEFSGIVDEEFILFSNNYATNINPNQPATVDMFKQADSLWLYDNKHYLTFYMNNASAIPAQNHSAFYAITKITFTQDVTQDFTFYIRDTSTRVDDDYVIVSKLSTDASLALDPGTGAKLTAPVSAEDIYAYPEANTKNNVALVPVTFTAPISANTYFYVVYRHANLTNSATFAGQVYLPVDNIRMSIGDNFQVLADGSVYASNVFLGGITKEPSRTFGAEEDNIPGHLSAVTITSGGIGNKESLDDELPGVYLGPDGISIGKGFKVTAGGTSGETEITLSDKLMNELKAATYTIISNTTQVVKDPISNSYNPSEVTFEFYKQLGSDTPDRLDSTDSTFVYSLDDGDNKLALPTDGKVTTSTFTSNSITCGLYLIADTTDRSKDILIASKTVSILNDAVSPYTLDIYNDKVSALTNTGTVDWTDDQWITNTTHKIKVLQGTVASKSEDITVRAGLYTADAEDKELVLVYESSNVSSVAKGTNTEYEVVNYITGITSEATKGEINYTLYYNGVAVASAKFEFLKVQFGNDGRSIEKVENFYYANNTDSLADTENPTKDSCTVTWQPSITATGYGPTKRYLWNYEKITYDKGTPLTSSTTPEVISYYASDGAPSITYWLNCSTNLHTGNSQTETITVTAMKKVGTDTEDTDDTARLYYRYATESTWTGGNASLNITTFKNEDLYILATHRPENGDGSFNPTNSTTSTDTNIYDWETITYSPLNTPTLDLTNDTATIAYNGNTKLGTDEVSTTANLYLNGSQLSARVLWFLNGCTETNSGNKLDTIQWSADGGVTTTVPSGNTLVISEVNEGITNATATCWVFEELYTPKLIVYRDQYSVTESGWIARGQKPNDYWSIKDSTIEVNDYFVVLGISTDEHKNHLIWYKTTSIQPDGASYKLTGDVIAHKAFYEKEFTITKQLKGDAGKGIKNIFEYYLTTSTADNPTTLPEYDEENQTCIPNGWSSTAVQPDSTHPYLWNVEIIEYTNTTDLPAITIPAIVGTFGETFGVNIEPSVSSIKLKDQDGVKTYTPNILDFKFREVSGTTVTDCCAASREYSYKIWKIEGNNSVLLRDSNANGNKFQGSTETHFELDLSQPANQTNGQYKVELYLKNNDAWIVVDTETIPVVTEANENLTCVIESSAGTSFNRSDNDFETRTTTLTAHLYEGTTKKDTNHEWYYEWWEIDTTTSQAQVLERLTANERADNYEDSDDYKNLTEREQEEYKAKKDHKYRGDAGNYQITLKITELQNKSIYFVAYPGGAPSTGGAILGIARLGVMPLGK